MKEYHNCELNQLLSEIDCIEYQDGTKIFRRNDGKYIVRMKNGYLTASDKQIRTFMTLIQAHDARVESSKKLNPDLANKTEEIEKGVNQINNERHF